MKKLILFLLLLSGTIYARDKNITPTAPKSYFFELDKDLTNEWAPSLITLAGFATYYFTNKPVMREMWWSSKQFFTKSPRVLVATVVFGMSVLLYDYYQPRLKNLYARI